ncbi:MAG TPA: lipoprotein insertase outer membrane protein LolB [Burkholderiales bacterium]|nr:lipoprotein insertase outer membrane protein LolB [Burkholderiales bacterium]
MRFFIISCGCAAVLALSGCATSPLAQPPATLNAVPESAFDLGGRIAVRYGNESSLANLHWRHQRGSDKLTLSTPLGQTVAVMTRDSQGVTFTDSNRQVHTAPTLEDLSQQMLGWRLPLQDLTYWVVGSVIPQQAYRVRTDTASGAIELAQSDWLVTYKRWTIVNGKELPSNLIVTGHGVTVRLVISDWRLE